MPSCKIQADIFTRPSVFDSPKGSSNTFKTHKNISLYFKRRYLIIYNSLRILIKSFKNSVSTTNRNNNARIHGFCQHWPICGRDNMKRRTGQQCFVVMEGRRNGDSS